MAPIEKGRQHGFPGASPCLATGFASENLLGCSISATLCGLKRSARSLSQSEVISKSDTETNGRKNLPMSAWLKSDVGILVLLAIARVVLHTATNGNTGSIVMSCRRWTMPDTSIGICR